MEQIAALAWILVALVPIHGAFWLGCRSETRKQALLRYQILRLKGRIK